jgi:hypothetical protein
LYRNNVPHEADLVCYWFKIARQKIEYNTVQRVGLLSPNSIRGGANRKVLENIQLTGNIYWAISDHEWILDGAAVNVSMICFDNGSENNLQLDGKLVSKINTNLTSEINIVDAKILKEYENFSKSQIGAIDRSEGP